MKGCFSTVLIGALIGGGTVGVILMFYALTQK
mgnify:CR=1 FL=1